MLYTVKCGGMTAVCNSLGAELISLKDDSGKEYIWCGDPAIWARHAPVLFPVVARTINDTVHINGKAYNMGIHGFANKSEFSVVSQTENKIVFELTENDAILRQYPFAFSLKVSYEVSENGYEVTFEVTNTGDMSMPFCIGGHPGFNCPGDFEDYRIVFEKTEDAWAYILNDKSCLSEKDREHTLDNTDTIYLKHSIFDRVDTLHFRELKSDSVRLLDKNDRGIQVDFADFPMLGLWTAVGKNAPYICIEPWHGCGAFEDETGELADKPYCITLDPDESRKLSYQVKII